MKVAIVVAGLPPVYTGGTEIATVEIARHATTMGHDIHVVALDGTDKGDTAYRELQDRYGFKVHRIPSIPRSYLYSLSAMPKAVTTVLNIKPDLIHAQSISTAPIAYVVSKLGNTPWLLYGRGEIYVDWLMKNAAHRFFLNRAHRIVAQTDDMRSKMSLYCSPRSTKIEVIPNGIDTSRFGKLSKQEARTKLGLRQDIRILLSVGRFRPEKNIRCFVEAAMMNSTNGTCSVDKGHYTEYIMVGDGEQQEDLKKLTSGYNNIKFVGAVPNNEIPTYMSAADILVNTSTSEGFPVSILEGMASGLPIVATKVCGIPEIVKDGTNGILVEKNSAKQAHDAIMAILNDRLGADWIATNNRQEAKKYSWEIVVRRLYGPPVYRN